MAGIPDGYNTIPVQYVVGSDDADNEFASTAVVSNADGSALERLEDLKDRTAAAVTAVGTLVNSGGTATLGGILGDVANSSIATRLTAIAGYLDTEVASILAAVDTEIATLQASVDGLTVGGIAVSKTVTFSNTAADVDLFDITGGVNLKVYAFCTTDVESAAGCNIGVDLGSTAIIADTDCTTLEANDVWHDAAPDSSVELSSVHEEYTSYGGTVVLDVEGAKQVDSGVIIFVAVYSPITTGATVAASA
jgi:hypothetical protein